MALSKVAIANGALQKLGAARISSLTQDHPNARSINAAYDRIRRRLIRQYAWSFAIRRDSIAKDAAQTLWGEKNRYTLPNDYLRLLRDDETGIFKDWRIEGLFIVTADASPLEIRYVADIDDPNLYDSLFADALSTALAYECCEEITQSTSRKESIREDQRALINEAKRIGAIEKEADEAPEDDWIAARR